MRFVGIDLRSTRGRPLRPPLQMKHKKQQAQNVLAVFLEVTPGFEPGSEGFADLCLTTWPRHQLYKIIGAEAPKCHFGAGDEARTRYLHLGKVALYRMSYTRIWCLRSESNQRHADFQSAALPAELQRHIEVSRSSPLLLFGDPERTRTVDLQRDRLAC